MEGGEAAAVCVCVCVCVLPVSVSLLNDVAGDGCTTVSLRLLPDQVHEVSIEVINLDILGRARWVCGSGRRSKCVMNS